MERANACREVRAADRATHSVPGEFAQRVRRARRGQEVAQQLQADGARGDLVVVVLSGSVVEKMQGNDPVLIATECVPRSFLFEDRQPTLTAVSERVQLR